MQRELDQIIDGQSDGRHQALAARASAYRPGCRVLRQYASLTVSRLQGDVAGHCHIVEQSARQVVGGFGHGLSALANRFGHLIANAARIGQPHCSLFRWRRCFIDRLQRRALVARRRSVIRHCYGIDHHLVADAGEPLPHGGGEIGEFPNVLARCLADNFVIDVGVDGLEVIFCHVGSSSYREASPAQYPVGQRIRGYNLNGRPILCGRRA